MSSWEGLLPRTPSCTNASLFTSLSQIDLESTLAQAEVLFLSFRGMVEEVDRNELVRAGQAELEEQDSIRKRRGSVSTIGSEPKRDLVSDDLRDLLVGWGSHRDQVE